MRKISRSVVLILILSLLIPTFNVEAASPKLSTPVITQDVKTVTEKSVQVTISNWGNADIKEYKIDDGIWQNYKAPFVVKSNGIIYARGKKSSGGESAIGKLEIRNIRKLLNKVEVSNQSKTVVKVVVYDINDNELGNGSGFIISSDGSVVTNYHVIDMAPKLKVITADGKTYDVIGVLSYSVSKDIAIIKLDKAEYLPTVTIGNSDDVALGEDAIAMGHPRGEELTVSVGNISSLNIPGALTRTDYKDFRMTAPISPGSSGGPLFNMYGEVVGINYSSRDDAQNMNRSIPINDLKSMLDSQIIKQLSDVIKEVYPNMNYSEFSQYLFNNYPDDKGDVYNFSFYNVYMIESTKYPGELSVFLYLNLTRYKEILLAEHENNKALVEKWLDGIYKIVKDKYPDKDVCVYLIFSTSLNERPEGYSADQAKYNEETGEYDIFKLKMYYYYENNLPKSEWL